jgi:hypothetical protein
MGSLSSWQESEVSATTTSVSDMLEARRASVWKNRYDIMADGRRLATWDESSWKVGGKIEMDGRRYEVRANMWGTKYAMVDGAGTPIASADRVGRKSWTVEADGRTYEFRRVSMWRQEEELQSEGQRVGSVRRNSIWRGDAVADLPGLPRPIEVFVLAVVLTMWDLAAASAATAG